MRGRGTTRSMPKGALASAAAPSGSLRPPPHARGGRSIAAGLIGRRLFEAGDGASFEQAGSHNVTVWVWFGPVAEGHAHDLEPHRHVGGRRDVHRYAVHAHQAAAQVLADTQVLCLIFCHARRSRCPILPCRYGASRTVARALRPPASITVSLAKPGSCGCQ